MTAREIEPAETDVAEMTPIKMLWIDDSAYFMTGVCKGFIDYTKKEAAARRLPIIEHFWWKLGDYYTYTPGKRSADRLEDEVKPLIHDAAFRDEPDNVDYILGAIKDIRDQYDTVAIDLVLTLDDIKKLKSDPELSIGDPPILSIQLYHDLMQGPGGKLKKCILYTSYGFDGGVDAIWKDFYAARYKDDGEDIYQTRIYDRAPMTDQSFNAVYVNRIVMEITKGRAANEHE